MKYEVKISRLAVVCVLCTAAFSSAFGAATVRSLGGVGTYSGTSAAATGTTSGTSAVRAGSLRVTPSVGGTASTSTAKAATTTGRAATTSRLSIGKYLGGVKAQTSSGSSSSGNSSSTGSSSGSMTPGVAADLAGRIGELEKQVSNVYNKNDVDAVLSDKQNVLTPVDNYIVIDKDEIYLDVDALQENLDAVAGKDGREIEIGSNNSHLLWRYNGDSAWQELIALSDITGVDGATGPQGPAGEKGEKGDQGEKGEKGDKGDPGEGLDASLYSTTEQMNQIIGTAIANANYVTPDEVNDALEEVTGALADKADKTALAAYATNTGVAAAIDTATADLATKAELNAKADAGAAYTKTESDAKYLTEHQSLDGYAKSSEIASVYATKEQLDQAVIEAADIDLSSYAKTTDLAVKADKDALPTKVSQLENDEGYLKEHQSLAGLATTDSVNAAIEAAKSDMVTQEDLNAYAKTEDIPSMDDLVTKDDLTEYAKAEDIPSVDGLVTQEDLEGYATTEEVTNTISETLETYTTEVVNTTIENAKTEITNEITNEIKEGDVVNNIITEQLENIQITNEQITAPDSDAPYMLGSVNGEVQWLEIVE